MSNPIGWCERTWNPISGCTQISNGCRNCYSKAMHKRLEHIKSSGYMDGKPHFSTRLHRERLNEPLRWKKPQRIFVCSMGDWMHDDVPVGYLSRVLDEIQLRSQHTFLTLTKRPENFRRKFDGLDLPNLWLGVSVENQKTADERIPILLQTPAAHRFVSYEPALEGIDLTPYLNSDGHGIDKLDWVIMGGESGHKAQPMSSDWARSVRDQCQAAGVPFFFKGWGGKEAGCLLDGEEWKEIPK